MNEYNLNQNVDRHEFLTKFSDSTAISTLKGIVSKILQNRNLSIHVLNEKYRSIKTGKKYKQPMADYIPIKEADKLYGYISLANLDAKLDKKTQDLLARIIKLSLKEYEKELELSKLYDTVRPRAIALSTIHTVHRLLSSTLNMDELIERIARLTLQVMRARTCSIMLLDKRCKHLVPKAIIDIKNHASRKIKRLRTIKIGLTKEGRVAKTGKNYLSKNLICVPLIEEDVIGIISAKGKTSGPGFNNFDLEILLTLSEQAVIAIKNAQMYEEQKKMAYGSIKSLAALLDAKSPNTYTHSEQFVKISLAIAEEMKLPREEIRNLHFAALLPDTGKFSIPEDILKKEGSLSEKEYSIIKRQHLESIKIIEPLEFLKPTLPIILYHHERYDGKGYPKGLKGGKIPIGARIMAVADAFEAMISSRPYKSVKRNIWQALKEIEHNSGGQFDPNVVDAFIAVSKKPEFKNIFHIR